MPYTYLTFAQARQQLASKLADEGNVRWTDTENRFYIYEALRMWNCLTATWKTDWSFNFNTGTTVTWINSGTGLPGNPSPRLQQVTYGQLYQMMQYHLQQPASGEVWTGTTQFQMVDLIGAVNRHRAEIQQQTACNTIIFNLPAVSDSRAAVLPDTILEVIRARWVPAFPTDGPPVTLVRDDRLGEMYYEAGYVQAPAGIPSDYDVSSVAPLQFFVDIAPNVPGLYEIVAIQASPDSTSPPTTTGIFIPDDFIWVLKNGAMADILGRESEATDRPRAEYFQKRYQDGLKLLQNTPWILTAYINNVPVDTPSLVEQDGYAAEWDSKPATLQEIITTGIDFFAVVPDINNPTSVTLSMLGNAPVPVLDSDPIQVSRDVLEAIIDYAQFLATIKIGGAEFQSALPLEANFIRLASMTNGRLVKTGAFIDVLYKQGARQEDYQERFSTKTQEE